LPVFFQPGTMPQLMLGLIICFLCFGAYMMFSPFIQDKHDYVSQICQLQIFFALLSGVVLNASPSEGDVAMMGLILMAMQGVPPAVTAFLSSPASKYALDPVERAKLFKTYNKIVNKVGPKLRLIDAKRRKVGKFKVAPPVSSRTNSDSGDDEWQSTKDVISTKQGLLANRLATPKKARVHPVPSPEPAATSSASQIPADIEQPQTAEAANGIDAVPEPQNPDVVFPMLPLAAAETEQSTASEGGGAVEVTPL
jgi:hypothetical protein